MNYKKMIIEFMQKKHEIIKEKTGIDYITDKDIEGINNWLEHEYKLVWRELQNNIMNIDGIDGLCIGTCPFCLNYYDCHYCEYGQNNGFCADDDSLTAKILDVFDDKILSNEFYKKIINNIEKNNE